MEVGAAFRGFLPGAPPSLALGQTGARSAQLHLERAHPEAPRPGASRRLEAEGFRGGDFPTSEGSELQVKSNIPGFIHLEGLCPTVSPPSRHLSPDGPPLLL